ncbi:hypothetical protein [Caballeronia grimmiae]|uniref:hypothetical protein n=1 Tax=Caballeronia grimmiae TaxID=1071679 RepID=UPI0038BB3968
MDMMRRTLSVLDRLLCANSTHVIMTMQTMKDIVKNTGTSTMEAMPAASKVFSDSANRMDYGHTGDPARNATGYWHAFSAVECAIYLLS